MRHAGDVAADDSTLLFLHLPKSGGTTLRHVLERQFPPGRSLAAYPTPESHAETREGRRTVPPALRGLTPEARSRFDLVSGHFSYGLHEHFAGPCRYLTFLRDPVERVISLYYHARSHPDHVMHPLIHEQDMSLADLLREDLNALEYDNAQTREVYGLELEEPFRQAVAQDADGVLRQAMRHLDEHFDAVGVMEAFDASLQVAAQRFGWRDVHYTVRNVTSRPSRRPEDAAEVRLLIREHNRLDEQLHAYARQRLHREIKQMGPAFQARLLAFKSRALARALRRRFFT